MIEDLTPSDRATLKRKLIYWIVGLVWLIVLAAVGAWFVVHEQSARANERAVARYVLCRELETIKTAQRDSLRDQLDESQAFLDANPGGIFGIPTALILRGMARDERLLKSLAPYPGNCAKFARDPDRLDVQIPETN